MFKFDYTKENFAQLIPLNPEEIFIWYFEQKGVDNPERFLAQQYQPATLGGELSAGQGGVNDIVNPSPLTPLPQGEGNSLNPENPLTQIINKIIENSKNKKLDISDVISKIKQIRKSRKDS